MQGHFPQQKRFTASLIITSLTVLSGMELQNLKGATFFFQLKLVIGLSFEIILRYACRCLSNYTHINLWQLLIAFVVLLPLLIKLSSVSGSANACVYVLLLLITFLNNLKTGHTGCNQISLLFWNKFIFIESAKCYSGSINSSWKLLHSKKPANLEFNALTGCHVTESNSNSWTISWLQNKLWD